MTTRWVALLRGIAPMNPNQKNVDLRGVCEARGLKQVTSVQSSGNLIFDADTDDRAALVAMLEDGWSQQLGFTSRTILRTPEELRALVALEPYGNQAHGRACYQLVTFFTEPIQVDATLPYTLAGNAGTIIHATERELFTATDNTADGRTPNTMSLLERAFGKDMTSRTYPTLSRILKRV